MIERRALDPATLPGVEERSMLRDSLRGFLETHWPAADAVVRATRPEAVAAIWSALVDQGVASLGSDPTEGGLREIAIAMEEAGRAACPAPLLGAVLANLALSDVAAGESAVRTGGAALPSDAATAAGDLLDALHAGTSRVCWSFGALDPNADAGAHRVARWRHGERDLALRRRGDRGDPSRGRGAARACCRERTAPSAGRGTGGLAIVELGTPTARVTVTRALGADALAEVVLDGAPARFVPLDDAVIDDLLRVARVAALARAHGAARRAFEMVVDYAKERRQFGQPIGRFQAIQHKLADALIGLEGVRLTLEHAAQGFDLGAAAWRYFAAAAVAFGGPALRRVSLETHHAFGAIGYAEEHEAPRHFRRAHLDALAFGGGAAARRELAAHLLDDPQAVLPEYDLGACRQCLPRRSAGLAASSTGAASARRRSMPSRSTTASSIPRSRATSARPAGSASAGRASSAGRAARRSSSSPSSR